MKLDISLRIDDDDPWDHTIKFGFKRKPGQLTSTTKYRFDRSQLLNMGVITYTL